MGFMSTGFATKNYPDDFRVEKYIMWIRYIRGLKANGYYDPLGRYGTYVNQVIMAMRKTGKEDLNKLLPWERRAKNMGPRYEHLLEELLSELSIIYRRMGVIDTDDPGC